MPWYPQPASPERFVILSVEKRSQSERFRKSKDLYLIHSLHSPSLPLDQELPVPHNLLVVDPDIKFSAHYIDMRGRIPFGPCVRAIRIPECNMHSGIFLVLQYVPDHFFQIDVGANGEFANACAVFVSVRVLPEIVFQFAILGVRLSQPVSLHT